jgi:hypothetical protein
LDFDELCEFRPTQADWHMRIFWEPIDASLTQMKLPNLARAALHVEFDINVSTVAIPDAKLNTMGH